MSGASTVTNDQGNRSTGLWTGVRGTTSGTRVVLLHGFTQTHRSWDVIADALVEAGYEVIALDLPGHGRSGGLRAGLTETAELVAAAAGTAVYVGYSMGGRVALHLALAAPQLVRGLVLIGATPGLPDEAQRLERRAADEALARGLERDGVDAFLARWLANPLFATLSPDASGVEARRANTVEGLASSLRRCGTGMQDPLQARLATITAPVRVLAGSLDRKFSAIGTELAAAIGANASFGEIEGAGHAAHLERPAAVVHEITGLVRATADPPVLPPG